MNALARRRMRLALCLGVSCFPFEAEAQVENGRAVDPEIRAQIVRRISDVVIDRDVVPDPEEDQLSILGLGGASLVVPPDRSPEEIPVPRIPNAEVTIDGRLSEAVWRDAALLRGFFQYLPADDRPAEDSTSVHVFYSETAIYFGVRAYQDSALVRATLADRDRISNDDYVEIVLDTFNDRRQAFLFGVNALGAQADGILRDAAQSGGNYRSSAASAAYTIDLNPDFVYESRGHLAPWGFEIEVRIPFKTLRYQSADVQRWGVNVIRHVQHSGHEYTWTRVLQANASFLAQGGALTGLTGMRRGLVIDLTPEVTSAIAGAPATDGAGWQYAGGRPDVGGNVRWGITNNLTLNGTANPDFSQVEADVTQLEYDPRLALYYPEKRPFFLDGIEYFATPTQLVYTRRLADPIGAAKLAGKVSGTNVALLWGADDQAQSVTGTKHPLYTILRLRRDVGSESTLGVAYTDKMDGDDFNRVAAADGRLLIADRYAVTFQGGGSVTRAAGTMRWAPMWVLNLDRSGRTFGLNVVTRGLHPEFDAAAGFISRPGIVYAGISPRYTRFGEPGASLESWTASVLVDGMWDWHRFFDGAVPNDPRLHVNLGLNFRGGWRVGGSVLVESFMYPGELYGGYAVERAIGSETDTVPFVGTNRLYNLDFAVNFATPRFQRFSANGFVIVGRDDNFYEWAPANIAVGTLTLDWRPSERLRVNVLYNHQQYIRPSDWSVVAVRRVPRLKVEYQLGRSVFVRFVGQYDAQTVDALRDDSRTGDPILVWSAELGEYERTVRRTRNDLRVDWLFSFRPTPGTVLFLGYGGSLAEPDAFRFSGLRRMGDGFFMKGSYLLRW